MIMFDPLFLIMIAPAALLALWAHFKVKSSFAAASKMHASSNLTGAQAARHILDSAGLRDVAIEMSQGGGLSDHYDPRGKVLRLSQEVHSQTTLAAVGIAAHEAGHALQDAKGYGPLVIRNGLVPMAATGGQISSWCLMGGILLAMFAGGGLQNPLAFNLVLLGVIAFGATVVFQLVNLPVEFNASSRAKAQLVGLGIVAESEMKPIKKVLSAAAMTYVAATLMAMLQMLYWVLHLLAARD
ncbi:MAG: zinc metallopeptidase [Phycisphaeraceae bacterium]